MAICEDDTLFYGYEDQQPEFMLQKTESRFLLTNLRVLKNLSKSLKKP